jgi:hypothetical protein
VEFLLSLKGKYYNSPGHRPGLHSNVQNRPRSAVVQRVLIFSDETVRFLFFLIAKQQFRPKICFSFYQHFIADGLCHICNTQGDALGYNILALQAEILFND